MAKGVKGFPPGTSGNPAGRPKGLDAMIKVAQSHFEEAFACLHAIMMDTKEETKYRIEAATAILDRGYGKPAQMIMQKSESTVTQKMSLSEAVSELKILLPRAELANELQSLPAYIDTEKTKVM